MICTCSNGFDVVIENVCSIGPVLIMYNSNGYDYFYFLLNGFEMCYYYDDDKEKEIAHKKAETDRAMIIKLIQEVKK